MKPRVSSGRNRLTFIHLCLFLLLWTPCLSAQQARWSQLKAKAIELYSHGNDKGAASTIRDAIKFAKRNFGPQDPHVARAMNSLACIYEGDGQDGKARRMRKEAEKIERQGIGTGHLHVAAGLEERAQLYEYLGRFHEAMQLIDRARWVREQTWNGWGEVSCTTMAVTSIGGPPVFDNPWRHPDAEKILTAALKVYQDRYGANSPDVNSILENLAMLYVEQGKYSEARSVLKQSLASHPSQWTDLSELAAVDQRMGDDADGVRLYKTAESQFVREREGIHSEGTSRLAQIPAAMNEGLAQAYEEEGDYADALSSYKQALSVAGDSTPQSAALLISVGQLDFARNQPAEAESNFQHGLGLMANLVNDQFVYMSERHRLRFLGTLSYAFPLYFSFASAYVDRRPSLAGRMYDLLLWEKGMVASGITSLDRGIEVSGTPREKALFAQVKALRMQISDLMYTAPADPAQRQEKIENLQAKADALDQQLATQSAAFRRSRQEGQAKWQQVRNSLHPGEAAVEYVRYSVYDGKKWTGKRRYAALVLVPGSARPRYIPLGDAAVLEGKPVREYRRWVKGTFTGKPTTSASAPASSAFYDAFWKPLLPALGQAKTIYVSPAGVLDQVAMGVVRMPDGKLLMDRYDLRLVDSMRDLLDTPQPVAPNTAVLVGDPKFYFPRTAEWKASLQSLNLSRRPTAWSGTASAANGTSSTRYPQLPSSALGAQMNMGEECGGKNQKDFVPPGGVTCPLTETQGEVDSIAKLLREKNWAVSTYLGASALEEVVMKRTSQPRLLVLATHGFFLSSPKVMRSVGLTEDSFGSALLRQASSGAEDPMLLSGLLFAGVDSVREGFCSPPGAESGILTAYDVSTLDLQGTELVVLSACDTGLGKIRAGEGVFGLRRGFEEAGAQAVLMSMWSVPAPQTSELMSDFIENWLGKAMTKHQALLLAQSELRAQIRKRYHRDFPYYWGAWVLVGP
jgi:tetratricopeptide (TPR) repeat protein